jgi:hypothetical protein
VNEGFGDSKAEILQLVDHIGHIHMNTAVEGGGIALPLSQ